MKKYVRWVEYVIVIFLVLVVGIYFGIKYTENKYFSHTDTEVMKVENNESISETDTTENKEESLMWQVYAEKVEMYLDTYDIVIITEDIGSDRIDANVNPEYTVACQYDDVIPAFTIYDLNNDGTPELFIGLDDTEGKGLGIYDVFTYAEGEIIQLMEGIGYRAGSCILCEDGVIMDQSSGGAADSSIEFHILPAGGKELSTIDVVSVMLDAKNPNIPRYYRAEYGSTDNEISKEEYNQIWQSYEKVNISDYITSASTISKLNEGTLELNIKQ